MADDAGAMLVRSGLVSAGALADARAQVEQQGGTIGEQLVAAGALADDALTDFYRVRLLVPMVNPNSLARLSAKVVAVIPSDMAIELRAVPVSLDAENNLTVAMSDPSDTHAVDEIAFFTGAYVVRAVATQMQIAWCLAHYYGHVTPLGTRLMEPDPTSPTAAAASPAQPRARGYTAKVNATRHRALAPITSQVEVQRPDSKLLDDPTPEPASAVAIALPPPDVGPADAVPRAEADASPSAPRARTASGEIRIPRAQSVKPPLLVDEPSGPVITIEVSEDATGPVLMPPPRRKTPARTDPPELRARAGEVSIATGPLRLVEMDTPSIVIAPDAETPTIVFERPVDTAAPVVIHSAYDRESQPILLERKRPSEPPASEPTPAEPEPEPALAEPEPEPEDEVVVLDAPKRAPRPAKHTQVGMGAVTAATRAHRDTEADGAPSPIDDIPTSQVMSPRISARIDAVMPFEEPDDLPTRVDGAVAPDAATVDEDPIAEPPPAAPPPKLEPPRTTLIGVAAGPAAEPEAPAAAPAPRPRRISYDPIDDGWGPTGTTKPPPLLGAMPGADPILAGAGATDGQTIPIENVSPEPSAPLVAAPITPPPGVDVSGASLVRELEETTARAIELIRRLDAARDRDEVIAIMVDHLATSHRRAGFFVHRANELALRTVVPPIPVLPTATLPLDRASTLADVVGTRLPYRGPASDDASRAFLIAALGACPPEILLVPITVRERVVGVLFGEYRMRPTFDDQLALAARAAGLAFERILAKKRS
jgi:hypothetical protein